MIWLTVGGVVAISVILINVGINLIYLRKLRIENKKVPIIRGKNFTKIGIIFCGSMVCFMSAGPIAPIAAPNSDFAAWISGEYSLVLYWIWCVLIFTAIEVILTWCGLRIRD